MNYPTKLIALTVALAGTFSSLSLSARPIEIDSLRELRKAATESNQEIRMAPGHYTIKGFEDSGTTVMEFSGSNNTFDLTGVTIEFPTELFKDMTRTKVHGLRKYTMYGDKLTFKGGRFVDSGDTPPNVSIASIFIEGDDVSFIDCQFSVRGSSPYGVGDMLGKGRGSSMKLQKHSVICITGDRPYIKDCLVRVHTYGHGIHIHGSQDAHLDGVIMLGNQRNTSDILDSKDPLMKEFDYKYQYPDWKKGKPIPRDEMIGLTEDGIRAYLQGDHKSGETRRTGHILVENCKINSMRGGITLAIGGRATVKDSLAINCSHGFSLPSNSTIENCQANVTNGPALSLPYAHKGNSTVEIELLEHTGEEVGTHALAEISGSGHDITFTMASGAKPKRLRPILIGSTGDRYTEDSTSDSELAERNKASNIKVNNKTPHPVVIGRFAEDCTVRSDGEKIKE
ncbi:MAG: hypothetical protein ACSHYA_11970 [Opitutaceae bacterium]